MSALIRRRGKRTELLQCRVPPSFKKRLEKYCRENRISVSTFCNEAIWRDAERHIDEIPDEMRLRLWANPPLQNPDEHEHIELDVVGEERRAERSYKRRAVPGGDVYIIRCQGLYKIGRAVDYVQRIAGMTLPEKPRLILVLRCQDYGFVEKALHALFAHKRKRGEWFDLSAEDLIQAKQYLRNRAEQK